MDTELMHRTLTAARGFEELGMWEAAWEEIETLPHDVRLQSCVIAARLRVCIGLPRWEMGATLARLISPAHPDDERRAAGLFYFAHAAALCESGDIEAAKRAVAALSLVYPEGRLDALESGLLAPIWPPPWP